jgi:4-hydroxythreonine-4-phosphate dehydrogenase
MRPLVVTQGDPLGVGPELLLLLAAGGHLRGGDVVVASPDVLARIAGRLEAPWARVGFSCIEPLVDAGALASSPRGAVDALERAVDLVLEGRGHALVTAPIDKARCAAAGFRYPGHTEYLAARSKAKDYAMLLVGPRLRVALATIHLPLREVAARLEVEDVVRVGRLLAGALVRYFGIPSPRIGILGVNPHAGERGLLGDEEARIVRPAVDELGAWAGADAAFVGPLSADSAFHEHAEGRFDGLVAMYHDQGLGPFKLLHFRDGVNMTLGLPYVRTSPDHGTAMDIAGTGRVDPTSMIRAVDLARDAGR